MKILNVPVEILRVDEKNFTGRTGEPVKFYKVTFIDETGYVIATNTTKEVAEKVGEETRVTGEATFEVSPDREGSSRLRMIDFVEND